MLLCIPSGFVCADGSVLFAPPSTPLPFYGVVLAFLFNRLLVLLLRIPTLGNTLGTDNDILAGCNPPSRDALSLNILSESIRCDVLLDLPRWVPPAILPPTVHLQLSTLCSIPGWLLQLYVFPYLSSFEVMYVNSSCFALGFSDAKAYS